MEKKIKLLNHFDDKYKGVALNEVLYFVRSGKSEPIELISNVKRKLAERVALNAKWGNGQLQGTNAQWQKYFREISPEDCFNEFWEAIEYAEEWERKTPEEKQKEKDRQAEYFKKQSMRGKPPTEKQIELLKSKGLKDIPNDRFECSEIIDKLLK